MKTAAKKDYSYFNVINSTEVFDNLCLLRKELFVLSMVLFFFLFVRMKLRFFNFCFCMEAYMTKSVFR